MISEVDNPLARRLIITDTGICIPRIQAWPAIICGSKVMRSSPVNVFIILPNLDFHGLYFALNKSDRSEDEVIKI